MNAGDWLPGVTCAPVCLPLHLTPSGPLSAPPCLSDFSLVDGHCFKTFLVGKTNTLNYYQPVNASAPIQVRPPCRCGGCCQSLGEAVWECNMLSWQG